MRSDDYESRWTSRQMVSRDRMQEIEVTMTRAPGPDGKADSAASSKTGTSAESSPAKGCKAYAVDLSAYFDHELQGTALERMEAHLEVCENCREALVRLGTLRKALHALARPPRRRRSILEDLQMRLAEEESEPAQPAKPLIS